MSISNIREKYEIIDLFCNLAEIPSPSLREDNVINWIVDYCKTCNFDFELDDYKNIYIKIPATDNSKTPILLSSHLDVVGDESPVEIFLDGDLIKAKNRTLGADDKAGVAQALILAKELQNNKEIKHGGLEIVFTRDEENGMTGIHHVDFEKIQSKDVFVLDSDFLGDCMYSGASYISGQLFIEAPKGGHSGNDIEDETRQNAVKLIVDLLSAFPQGVYKSGNDGRVLTSINLGGVKGGDINVTNVINTFAEATFSIRSSDMNSQSELIDLLKYNVDNFNKDYAGMAKATLEIKEKMPMFVNSSEGKVTETFAKVAPKVGVVPKIGSFHAGAETHIYALNKNAKGENFSPYLLGLATICNMHSSNEYVDYKTILKGQELLKEFFTAL